MMRRALGTIVLLALAWLLAASSGVGVTWYGEESGRLRLSWVARPERIEECRDLSEVELARRPVHMRQARECRGGSATYRLTVRIDGRSVAQDVVTGGGLRSDRAIFVLREYRLPPGARRIQLQFARVEASDAPMDSANVRRGAVPRALTLDTTVQVPRAGVALVSLSDGALTLTLP